MRITFVLPGFRPRPVGGFLVVYRYANELVERGHEVAVVHPHRVQRRRDLTERMKSGTWPYRKRIRYGGRPPWFEVDPRVKTLFVRDLDDETSLPPADAIFATACETAAPVLRYGRARGVKLYLIQHYEEWACGKEVVDATWRMPMHKVVCSQWLLDIGVRLGEAERLTHIPYGVELDIFQRRVPPAERSPVRVGMLAHHFPFKGMAYGITALERVRKVIPELDAVAFGAGPRRAELPGWVRYMQNPTRHELVDFYNSLAIFMHTSVTEGWGLTGAEALACGCALVAADSGGVRDYAIDGETALLVPPRDPVALAERTIKLIRDQSVRLRVAETGHAAIQEFTWTRAADALDLLVRDICRGRLERVAVAHNGE